MANLIDIKAFVSEKMANNSNREITEAVMRETFNEILDFVDENYIFRPEVHFCDDASAGHVIKDVYADGIIVLNEFSKLNPGSFYNKFRIRNNVTKIELKVSKLIEVAGVDARLPLLEDENGDSILMESGDNYLTEVFPDYPILRFSDKSLFFRRSVDGWAFYVEEEDFKNNNFNRLSGTALFTGSANSSFSLTPSGVISDKTYIIINAKNGSYTVAVTFNSNPQNYSSAVITIKNKATAVTAATPQLEFSGSMRFMYSSLLSKFVIL